MDRRIDEYDILYLFCIVLYTPCYYNFNMSYKIHMSINNIEAIDTYQICCQIIISGKLTKNIEVI